jgi:hypothetical protein
MPGTAEAHATLSYAECPDHPGHCTISERAPLVHDDPSGEAASPGVLKTLRVHRRA